MENAPPSVVQTLERLPQDRPIVCLMRHAERQKLPPDGLGYTLPITRQGELQARALGRSIGERLRALHASPLTRCLETADALRQGAERHVEIIPDRLLGDPGVYVLDGKRAWPHWQARGNAGVTRYLVEGDGALSGMSEPSFAARFLVQHMLAGTDCKAGVHVFVTHDTLVAATVGRLFRSARPLECWPDFLQTAFFWRDGEQVFSHYLGEEICLGSFPLCKLSAHDVIEFARRELASTIGLDCGAHIFLAGGCFKQLLTGRPAKDLDLWAASKRDRQQLLHRLQERGAESLPALPFADAFLLNERVVEVPHEVGASTLDALFLRFDLGLSAVGVEYQPSKGWGAKIHPLAKESLTRRELLFLKPLKNWKYALTTLERGRRYASELGFCLPETEEEEVWRLFSSQTTEMRIGMIERHKAAGRGGFGVMEEAMAIHAELNVGLPHAKN